MIKFQLNTYGPERYIFINDKILYNFHQGLNLSIEREKMLLNTFV